jgi:hypothetical protein
MHATLLVRVLVLPNWKCEQAGRQLHGSSVLLIARLVILQALVSQSAAVPSTGICSLASALLAVAALCVHSTSCAVFPFAECAHCVACPLMLGHMPGKQSSICVEEGWGFKLGAQGICVCVQLVSTEGRWRGPACRACVLGLRSLALLDVKAGYTVGTRIFA